MYYSNRHSQRLGDGILLFAHQKDPEAVVEEAVAVVVVDQQFPSVGPQRGDVFREQAVLLLPFGVGVPALFAPRSGVDLGEVMRLAMVFQQVFLALNMPARRWADVNDFRAVYRRLRGFERALRHDEKDQWRRDEPPTDAEPFGSGERRRAATPQPPSPVGGVWAEEEGGAPNGVEIDPEVPWRASPVQPYRPPICKSVARAARVASRGRPSLPSTGPSRGPRVPAAPLAEPNGAAAEGSIDLGPFSRSSATRPPRHAGAAAAATDATCEAERLAYPALPGSLVASRLAHQATVASAVTSGSSSEAAAEHLECPAAAPAGSLVATRLAHFGLLAHEAAAPPPTPLPTPLAETPALAELSPTALRNSARGLLPPRHLEDALTTPSPPADAADGPLNGRASELDPLNGNPAELDSPRVPSQTSPPRGPRPAQAMEML